MSEGRDSHKGFTLVELLVVVAIVALLISILLPSLNQARKQARQLLCVTNLRTQGQAAMLYAEENRGMIPCGILSTDEGPANSLEPGEIPIEWSTAHIVLLKYLDYTPDPTVKFGRSELKNLFNLNGSGQSRTVNAYERQKNAFRRMKVYQCPDHPNPDSALDYVTNAMPIPFTQIQVDESTDLEPGDDPESESVKVDTVDYYGSRPNTFSRLANPAKLIYITGSFATLDEDIPANGGNGTKNPLLFHAFFLGTHLPFAPHPRIANDQRHPGGVNAAFFDGHAETMALKKMDPGWPTLLSIRLQWFSPYDRGVQDP